MANYECTVRTNYFHVKNEAAFRELMNRVYGSENSVDLWEKPDETGMPVFAFGCYGEIAGVKNAHEDDTEDVDDSAYDEFIDGLQACIADNDAIIIQETGHEKLNYVMGLATIITSRNVEYVNLSVLAQEKASQLLGSSDWNTTCDY